MLVLLLVTLTMVAAPVAAQSASSSCSFVCAPSITLDVAAIRSHVAMSPEVRMLNSGAVTRLPSTTNAELLLVVGASTALPRTSLFTSLQWLPTAKATRNPFTEYTASELGDTKIRANSLSATFGVSVTAIDPKQTAGWASLSGYVGDLFSNAARPGDESDYTHKLDLGAKLSAMPFSHATAKATWLNGVSAFAIVDYVATGLPKAGDEVPKGSRVFVDDAHALSLIAGIGLPIAMSR